jgi:5-deoxy-glucuronate isomerase
MQKTLAKYADRIERNEVNPHLRYDGKKSGLILDPLRDEVPLEVIGFGILQLGPEFIKKETGGKEIVLIPQEGRFEAEVGGRRFSGQREGGPFAVGPGKSNSSALYVSCNSELRIRGKGEMAFFEAPAFKQNPPFYFSTEEGKVMSRGAWVWRRDVVNLISPKNASTNLVVGETYSPPGLWSGTPLHVHDKDDLPGGESDLEEIYYHRMNPPKKAGDQFGPYAVQLLFDGEKMMKSYLLGDRSVFAIPGGSHPVIASPVAELLYLWGLGGGGADLAMRDIPEFKYLKSFEEAFQRVAARSSRKISGKDWDDLCASFAFTDDQKKLLKATLKEQEFDLE